MSQGRFFLDLDRHGGRPTGSIEIVDGLVHDGLVDPALGLKMGALVERHPDLAHFTREQMDRYAYQSQMRADVAFAAGRLEAEIAAVRIDGETIDDDEPRRPDSTREGLAALPPAFDDCGRITAGNSSKIADGAALVVLCDPIEAIRRELPILAVIEGWAQAAGDPWDAPLAAADAIAKLCRHLGRGLCAYDWIEINEAFAVQVTGCLERLGLDLDDERINPDGGAIAIGHPVATSAARIVGHVAHAIAQGRARRGLAAVGVGGGMGVAISLRAP